MKEVEKNGDPYGVTFYTIKGTDIFHNPAGPAIIDKDGEYVRYYINGEVMTKEEHAIYKRNLIISKL